VSSRAVRQPACGHATLYPFLGPYQIRPESGGYVSGRDKPSNAQLAGCRLYSSLRCLISAHCSRRDSPSPLSGRLLCTGSHLSHLHIAAASHLSAWAPTKHTPNQSRPVPPPRNHPCARFTQSIGTHPVMHPECVAIMPTSRTPDRPIAKCSTHLLARCDCDLSTEAQHAFLACSRALSKATVSRGTRAITSPSLPHQVISTHPMRCKP